MSDDTVSVPAAPVPSTVRLLSQVLLVQAGLTALGAVVAVVSYLVRAAPQGGMHLYGEIRTHPVAMVILSTAIVGVLLRLPRLIPRPLAGAGGRIRLVEVVLLVDHAAGLAAGVFNVWLIAGVLLAVVALWLLRTREAADFLAR
jgi:hypothetical protein